MESPNPNLITHSFLVKLNQDGTYDESFGNNGLTVTNLDYKDLPTDVVIQDDHRILLGGIYTSQNSPSGVFPNSPFIIRYSNEGNLDNSFGNNGIVKITAFNSITSTSLCSIVLLNDGKIIIGVSGSSNSNNFYGALVKLTSTGAIDTSFGSNGILNLGDLNFKFNIQNLILTDDNKLLLCGYDSTLSSNIKTAILKLDTDGFLDISFASDGKLVNDINSSNGLFEYFNKISTTPDNKFICSGFVGSNFLMIKFDSFGQLDESFSNNGIFEGFNNIQDIEIQNTGNIVLGGIELEDTIPFF